MPGNRHTDEVRAAVMAAFLAGSTIGQIMKEYDLPKATAARWRREAFKLSEDMSEEVGDMLLRYLVTNLETLISQAETFRNQRWLLTQSASDVAVLHGVMTDKAIRLIEALSKHAELPEPEAAQS
jgi:transposase-like protein